jgi:hypothetical protein
MGIDTDSIRSESVTSGERSDRSSHSKSGKSVRERFVAIGQHTKAFVEGLRYLSTPGEELINFLKGWSSPCLKGLCK